MLATPPLDPRARPLELTGSRSGVLLLHGFTGTPFEVRPLAERLHRQSGYTVLAPLLAGHGRSADTLDRTGWRDWEASALEAFLRLRSRCDRVAIAGLSMGGLLGLRIARERPDELRALVLMAVPIWLPLMLTQPLRLALRLGFPARIRKAGGSDVRDRIARAENPSLPEFPLKAVGSLVELMDVVRPGLESIRTPTLILQGKHDHAAPPACAPVLARRLGGPVRLRWLERSYHLLPIDVERERTGELTGAFLEEHL